MKEPRITYHNVYLHEIIIIITITVKKNILY